MSSNLSWVTKNTLGFTKSIFLPNPLRMNLQIVHISLVDDLEIFYFAGRYVNGIAKMVSYETFGKPITFYTPFNPGTCHIYSMFEESVQQNNNLPPFLTSIS